MSTTCTTTTNSTLPSSRKDLIYGIGTCHAYCRCLPRGPYLSTLASAQPDPTIKAHYAAPDTFQIICAGMDNDFGLQVGNSNR